LSREQLVEVEAVLAEGAAANGYPTDLWTLARVAEVIERISGVSYHPRHVWRVLRQQLGWSWQRPARRAVERDEATIARWLKRRWPQLKKGRGASTH
jgi:transposase